jgi:hypothetical protein
MDKEQYDIIKGAMDVHAENVSIAFGEYLRNFKWNGNYWENWGGLEWSTEYLYKKFKQEITCKKDNPDAFVNLIQKPENQ